MTVCVPQVGASLLEKILFIFTTTTCGALILVRVEFSLIIIAQGLTKLKTDSRVRQFVTQVLGARIWYYRIDSVLDTVLGCSVEH